MSLSSHFKYLYNGGLDDNANPSELNSRRTFSTFIMSLAPVACLLMATNYYFDSQADNPFIAAGTAVILSGLYIQAYLDRRELATHLVVLTYWTVLFFLFFDYGIIGTPIFWLFPIAPMAILLIGIKAGWIWCVICILSLYGIWFLEAQSILVIETSFRTLINTISETDSGLVFASDGSIILLVLTFATTVFKRSQSLAETRLNETVASLQQEVAIRRLAEQKAIDSEKAKSVFLAAMGHELRTPLNGIIGASRLLKDSNDQDEQDEFTQIISHSGETLLELINNVLDLSSLEAGKLQIEETAMEIGSLVDQTLAPFHLQAKSKHIKLNSKISPSLPKFLLGDPTRFRQLLINLVGNAIKFTSKGEVRIVIDEHDHKLRLRVIDTGIGIPKSAHASLFEPYVQASADTTRNYGGSGLGLAIVKSLTEAMSGEISVESDAGNGSCFTVVLPLREGLENQAAESPPPIANLSSLKILVVDDNAVNRMVLSRILEKDQHNVVAVTDGQEAVHYALSDSLDLILMDIQMPIMDGLTATKKIRQSEGANRDTPIVAITANLAGEDKHNALDAGMNGFVSKPFRYEELTEVIASCTNS